MSELILLMMIAAYSFGIGRRLLRWSGCEFTTGAGRACAAVSLGLGFVAHAVLALGLLSQLNLHAVVGTAIVALAAACLPDVRFIWSQWVQRRHAAVDRAHHSVTRRSGGPRLSVRAWAPGGFLLALVGVAIAGSLISALAPPTAGDALCYHLEIPKRFVQLGEIRFLPLTDNSLFPFLMEMLYTLGLLVSGPVLAQLLHWLVGVLFALAAVELATPVVGRAGGWWAGVVALLVPGVTNQMTAPLNDLAVALYCTLMVIGCIRWMAAPARRWLLLSGVFGGLALGTKLVAAGMVTVCVLVVVVAAWRRRGLLPAGWHGLQFVACVLLVGGVWYARSWYHLGNPVYPYFNAWFGGEAHTRSLLVVSNDPLTIAWSATMQPEQFGGRGVQFGAVFLAILPCLALVKRPAGLSRLLAIAACYAALWFAARQELRFLLPIVPLLAVGVVAAVAGLRELHRPACATACACVAGLLVFQSLIVVKRAQPCLRAALGLESREHYLKRHEPSYAVARFVNSQLPAGTRLISQDYRGLYFDPDFVREDAMRRRFPYDERGELLVARLAAGGFTHILLVQAHNPNTAIYDQEFTRRLGAAADRLPLAFSCHFEGRDGDRRDYRLLALPPAGVATRDRAPEAVAGRAN